MKYASFGNLRDMLKKHYTKLSWKDKLANLCNISLGLKGIHNAGLVHKDFHAGNIVMDDLTSSYFTDFGLCQPISQNAILQRRKEKIYGVLPYVAPEVLDGKEYTKESEIYSFGIIMSEILTGYPPYYDVPHDNDLAIEICKGIRPKIRCKVPQLLLNLMNKCLDAKPLNRPTAAQLFTTLHQFWKDHLNDSSELAKQIKVIESSKKEVQSFNYTTHPLAVYKSRPLEYENLPETVNVKIEGNNNYLYTL